MSGGGGSTSTQSSDPWSGQQPYLNYGFDQASKLYNSGGPEYFGQSTVAPMSGNTQAGITMMANRGLMGSDVNRSAQGLATNTMNGGFLGSNPHLSAMSDAAGRQVTQQYQNSVMPGVNATFGGAGRTGSQAHLQAMSDAQSNLGTTLGDMNANLYGNNYESERDRMLQTQSMAPGLAATDYQDISAVAQAGQRVDSQAQNVLNDQVARFDHYQNRPDQQLQNYIAAIQGNYGGQATTSQSGGGNSKAQNAIGGAAALGGLGSALALSNPITGALAVGGGLLGAFG